MSSLSKVSHGDVQEALRVLGSAGFGSEVVRLLKNKGPTIAGAMIEAAYCHPDSGYAHGMFLSPEMQMDRFLKLAERNGWTDFWTDTDEALRRAPEVPTAQGHIVVLVPPLLKIGEGFINKLEQLIGHSDGVRVHLDSPDRIRLLPNHPAYEAAHQKRFTWEVLDISANQGCNPEYLTGDLAHWGLLWALIMHERWAQKIMKGESDSVWIAGMPVSQSHPRKPNCKLFFARQERRYQLLEVVSIVDIVTMMSNCKNLGINWVVPTIVSRH